MGEALPLFVPSGVRVATAGEGLPLLVAAPLPVPGSCVTEELRDRAAVGVSPPLRLATPVTEDEDVAEGVAESVMCAVGDAPLSGLPLVSTEGEPGPDVTVAARGEAVGAPRVALCCPLGVSSALALTVTATDSEALPLGAPLGVAESGELLEAEGLPEEPALGLPVAGALGSALSVTGAVAEAVGSGEGDAAMVPVGDPVGGADALPVAAAEGEGVPPPLAVPAPLLLGAALPCDVAEGVMQALPLPEYKDVPEKNVLPLGVPLALAVACGVPESCAEPVAAEQAVALCDAKVVLVALPHTVAEAGAPVALTARQAVGVLVCEGGDVEEAVEQGLRDAKGEGDVVAVLKPPLLPLAGAFVAVPPLPNEALN